jgi:predicted DNA-binding transcriptional regulator AlpA
MKIIEVGFMRLPRVLEVLPFSRSAWFAGVKSGRFPKPIHLSPRTSAWRNSDILKLAEELSAGGKTFDEGKINN